MTIEDDDEEERAYIEACVSTARKQYTRRRHVTDAALMLMIAAGPVVPWYFSFVGTSTLVWCVGVLVVLAFAWTERRLRTMQIRLATMHDLLHRIAGDSPKE